MTDTETVATRTTGTTSTGFTAVERAAMRERLPGAYELVYDSDDRERQGLARRRMYRTLAPQVTENPIFMHVRSADPAGGRGPKALSSRFRRRQSPAQPGDRRAGGGGGLGSAFGTSMCSRLDITRGRDL